MSKFLSGRLRQLLVGITGYTENKTVIQTTGKVGIGTTDAQQHSLFVVGSTNITGDTNVGGGLTAVGIGSFQSDVYVDQQLYVGGVNITGGASIGEDVTTRNLRVSGISTFVGIATAESTLFAAELSVAGISTFENNIDANGGLDVDGHTDLDNVSISGVTTTTGLLDANGGLTANQATVEDLTNDRIVVAGVGGRLEDSANLTFDGSRLEVVGHAELDDVNVSGTATITSLDVLTNFDVYDTQAVFHNNLYIAGNLSIGGTTTTLNAQDLQIYDKDIILGFTTDAFGNDISTDTTANHGGIAIASTEGSPLVPFFLTGVNEDIPDTYKQIMWVKSDSYGFGTTDAWLFNYAVGIGSTLVPNGTRFAVSEIQFTDDTINTPNISVSENLTITGSIDVDGHTDLDNVSISGVTTTAGLLDANGGLTANQATVEDLTDNRVVIAGTGGRLEDSVNLTFDGTTLNVVGQTDVDDLNVSGLSTFVGITTNQSTIFANQLSVAGVSTFVGNVTFQSNGYFGDGDTLYFGNGYDLQIYHTTAGGGLNYIRDSASGLRVTSDNFEVYSSNLFEKLLGATYNGSVDLYYDGIKRLETTGYGVTVYNTLQAPQLNITGIASVGTAITMYGATGIVSAISFYGDGSNLTNTGATLGATSGTERLVTTQLTSGTMVNAATDADLTYNATTDLLSTPNLAVSGGISTDGVDTGGPQYILRADGSGGWEWASVPGIFSVNNILNGFIVQEEGVVVGTAGSITTIDFRGVNIVATADPQPNGIATVRLSETPTFQTLNVSGITTLGVTAASQLQVTGLSTFVGVSTAESTFFTNQLSVAGVSSYFGDLNFGSNVDLKLASNGTIRTPNLHSNGTDLTIRGGGNTSVRPGIVIPNSTSNNLEIQGPSSGTGDIVIDSRGSGEVIIKDGGVQRFTTNNNGVDITGHTELDELNVSGVSTFVGTINAVDAIFTGNVTIGGTLTYEDVTNIDSIGIITARSDVRVGGNFSSVGITTLASAGGITTTGGDLYVGGNLYADGNLVYTDSSAVNLNITGIATFGGQISAGGTTGTDGQYLQSTGVGVTWASFPTLRTTQTTVATDGQTTFNFAYNVNFLDVFINGIKLTSSEYTATSGTQIILASPAFGGDIVEFHSYNTTSTGGSGGGGASILNDLSDVTIGSLSNNQILRYNSGSSVWENVTVSYATEAFVGLSTSGLASESYVGLATAGLASEAYVGLATAGLLSSTGDGSGLTNLPAGQLTGSLPAIDGSALTGLTTSRFTVSNNTGSIGAGTTTDITITGAKAYSLFKVETTHAAWIRLYTDTDSRTNDETRAYTTDPTPGSGVLAEVYTTTSGISTFKMTPAVTGWNDDATPSTNIYAKVTNNESGASDITVSLTIVRMED